MLKLALTISLLNLGIFILLSEGYVFHKINIALSNFTDKVFGLKWAAIIQEPLYQCYVCMSSLWTIVWWFVFGNGFSLVIIPEMLLVCGISYFIERVLTVHLP